mgnify:CR=1 FL=1
MSEKEINEIICKKLNYYMKLNNTTQTKLADYMGVSVATVSNWCKGIKTPRMSKVDKICEFFHIQRSDLLEDKEDKEETKVNNQIMTLAAHFEGDEFTAEEMEDIKNFVEFVKNKRK